MRQRFATLFPLLLIMFIGFVLINKNTAPRQTMPVVAQQIYVEPTLSPVPTATMTPYPTREQVINPATATALAPFIPVTPSPTLIPDSFAPGGENEFISSIWFGRLIGLIVLGMIGWLIYIFREIKLYEIEKDLEIKKAEIEAMTKLKINPRPILSTNIITNDQGDFLQLSNQAKVSKGLVIEFLKAVFNLDDERGLAVSKWKNSPGWTQADIENILDHLGEASMITKRSTGKACEWLTAPDKNVLCRNVFRLSPFELEE